MSAPTPTQKLCSRIDELLPARQLDGGVDEELASHLSHLQAEAAKQQPDVYTVSTYLRRIFAKLAKIESSAADEAGQEIRSYATKEGIEL